MSSSKPNAYSSFVQEIARQRRRAGQDVSMPTLFRELDKEWRALSDDAKQKYKDIANNKRQSFPLLQQNSALPVCDKKPETSHQPNYDCSSQSSNHSSESKPSIDKQHQKQFLDSKAAVERIKREHEPSAEDSPKHLPKRPRPNPPNWHKMKGNINYTPREYMDAHLLELREKSNSIFASKKQNLSTMPLYSFSTNVMCKHREQGQDIYVPLEIGIAAYTINDGKLSKPYHALINAGPIPKNCFNPASDHAEYHKITFPPKAEYSAQARKDYRKIYREMIDYTRDGERIVLISSARDLAQVKGCIEWIYKKASEEPGKKLPSPGTWTILPVVEYVASMYNFVFEEMLHQPVPPAMHYKLVLQLEASSCDYDDTLMCSYHRRPDYVSKWCAMGTASRSFLNLEGAFSEILQNHTKATTALIPVEIPTMSPDHGQQQDDELLQIEQVPGSEGQNGTNDQLSVTELVKPEDQPVPESSDPQQPTPALPTPSPVLAIEATVLLNEAERSQIY